MGHYKKPIVLMFLGGPGSGKSYFAKNIADKINAVRINGDSMRKVLFGSLEEMKKIYDSPDRYKLNSYTFSALDYAAEQIVIRGHDLIYDAHQVKRADRVPIEKMAIENNALPIIIRIKTPLEVAIKRSQEREETIDQRRLSREELLEITSRQEMIAEPPLSNELVIEIDRQQTFEDQFKEFERQLQGILR